MEYLSYYLTNGKKVNLTLNEVLSEVIKEPIYHPKLLKYICNRPEINKSVFLDAEKGLYMESVYLELSNENLIGQTREGIVFKLSTQLNTVLEYIDFLKEKREEEQETQMTTKNDILENIKNLKLKIKRLNPLEDNDLEQIQLYIEEINRQKKGLKREDTRLRKRTNEVISMYYTENIYKLEDVKEKLQKYLEIVKKGD